MATVVKLTRGVQKVLPKLPTFIVLKLQAWIAHLEDEGLNAVRKIPGYHDEPLKGQLEGLRSIRLSKGYRAYYRIVNGETEVVLVERVDKHEY